MIVRTTGACSALAALCACSNPSGVAPGTTAALQSRPTWYQDVQPIVDAKCVGCHQPGGMGPLPLQTYAQAAAVKQALAQSVRDRRMPPWMAAADCAAYAGDFSLAEEQVQTLLDWVAAGAPEGDPATASSPGPPPVRGLSRVDRTLGLPAPYTPTTTPDDYRCFPLDWRESATTHVTGFRARPGTPRQVHHVILYLLPESLSEQVRAADAADEGPGYTCFGGPTVGGGGTLAALPVWLGSWAPGSVGGDFPAQSGIPVHPGSQLVLQVHYNTAHGVPEADATSVELKLDARVEREGSTLSFANPLWVSAGTMGIPAGDPDVRHHFDADVSLMLPLLTGGRMGPGPFQVHSVGLHMHQLGTSAELGVLRALGAEQCLLRIPEWDFHWQNGYALQEPVTVYPGDRLFIRCQWDNSAAHQAGAPRDVNWGEGTADEMCLGILYLTPP